MDKKLFDYSNKFPKDLWSNRPFVKEALRYIKNNGSMTSEDLTSSKIVNVTVGTYTIGIAPTQSIDYTIRTIFINASAGDVILTLPDATTRPIYYDPTTQKAIWFLFKRIDSSGNAVTVNTVAGLIDGDSSQDLASGGILRLQTDGANWWSI